MSKGLRSRTICIRLLMFTLAFQASRIACTNLGLSLVRLTC